MKSAQKRIYKKLQFFLASRDPISFAKKLTGARNKFRFRVGGYRIIFSKQEDGRLVILLVLKVAHRKNVYE